MNPSANREGISVFARIAVFVVVLVLAATFMFGDVFARKDLPKPYIQPGDGDGPAGISEVVSHKVVEDNSISVFLSISDERDRKAVVYLTTLRRILRLQIILNIKKGN
jgi:hypothetical protein